MNKGCIPQGPPYCHASPIAWRLSLHTALVAAPSWMLRDPACTISQHTLMEPEIVDMRPISHVEELAVAPKVMLEVRPEMQLLRLMPCGKRSETHHRSTCGCLLSLQLPPPLPADTTALFARQLATLDLSLVPEVGRLHAALGVPRK